MNQIFSAVLIVCGAGFLIFYTVYTKNMLFGLEEEIYLESSNHIVDSLKCKILDVDPFNPQAKKYYYKVEDYLCTRKKLLSYVTIYNNTATLHLNEDENVVYCNYYTFERYSDNYIKKLRTENFEKNVNVDSDFVGVSCRNRTNQKEVYANVHAPIIIKNNVAEKQKLMKNKDKAFSVLLIGIDSISRLNFIRTLPKSHKFLMDNEWISLKGYNKIADNTFPNVMAILTGFDEERSFSKCRPKTLGGLDQCPMLWYDFRNAGYATAYAEDETWISTFNLEKKGFLKPPTDYYFRPYFISAEKLKRYKMYGLSYCTGPENTGQRVLNIVKDFGTTFVRRPHFGLFWMNSFSHNELNVVSAMDDKIQKFLQEITNSGILQNSVVIFLSDHGLRCGDFRHTSLGWLEERLPFIFIWIPHRFRFEFPQLYSNLKNNVHKLTSPYDLYMTLQHLFVLSGFNYTIKTSKACAKCKSLFTEIESERSCDDAGIISHWCTCTDYSSLNQSSVLVKKASVFTLQHIHKMIDARGGYYKCRKFSLNNIVAASISGDKKHILLVLEMKPKAVFEVTLKYEQRNNQSFAIKKGVSRIDRYKEHSYCTHNGHLKILCYCN